MKRKGLAIILLIAILASCLVFSAAADVNSASHQVYLTNCNYTIPGWSGMTPPTEALSVEGSDGSYMVKRIAANSYGGGGSAMVVSYANGKKAGDGIDLSGCDYLVLHAYFSNAEAASISMEVELNSNTRTCDDKDEQERAYTFGQLAGGTIQVGWNELKVPLSVLNNDQKANFQWFRMFNNAFTLSEELIIAIDKMYGAKEGSEETVLVSDCAMVRPDGWGSKATPAYDGNRAYLFCTRTGDQGTNGIGLYYNRAAAYAEDESSQYVDATGMKFLVFDLYVSDVTAVEGKMWCLEVSSGSTPTNVGCDVHEWGINKSFEVLSDYTLVNGWNHIVLGLDREDVGYTEGTTDWSHVNWFRLFNADTISCGEGFTWGLDNIYFWDGISDLKDGYEYEIHSKVGASTDDYVDPSSNASKDPGGTEKFYFCDTTKQLVLKFPIKNAATAELGKAFFTTKCGSQLHLSVSADGENWVDVWNNTANMTVGSRYFAIPESVDFKTSKAIYVKYADSTTNDGNGGRCYDIDLYVPYQIVETAVPHFTTITSLDTNAGVNWGVNTSIKSQGKASVSQKFVGAKNANGGILFQVKFSQLQTVSFDTTNDEAVVLDMYVSDASVIKNIKFQMEFCSGGNCDNEESSINDTFANYVLEGTTFKNGWNTIVLPFSKMGGALNRTKLNYIRFYNLDAATFENETIIAFDNLRLWDGKGSIMLPGDKYVSTKVQGFSVYTNGKTDAKYDSLHPTDANANVDVDSFSDEELQYLVFTNAKAHGNTSNRGRYHDDDRYSIWKFDTKDAETAKFVAACYNSIELSVSKDMENWTVVYSSGNNRDGQAIRTFDLTKYIDGDYMYVKAADSKPDDGWGFYIMPVGTYFVTTQVKSVANYDAECSSSFVNWSKDSVKYTVSDWWAGITGGHPFYDRNIGDNKKYGGPQVVYAFPTNPTHQVALVNLALTSNAIVEVSTDFVTWTLVAQGNYCARSAGWLDISDGIGGSDMVYVRVRSPENLNGNGPQIWNDTPIQFVSMAEEPESRKVNEILWDDCSTADNVDLGFTYNEELGGIGVTYSGQDNVVLYYGKANARPVDIRFMKYFEFDVYIEGNLPNGFHSGYVVELLDEPRKNDVREIQYNSLYLNEGWNHIVLPLPGTYSFAGSSTGAIDLSKIQAFRMFKAPEDKSLNYTLVIKNLKFTKGAEDGVYLPATILAQMNPDPNDKGDLWNTQQTAFDLDIGDANAVELDIYHADPTKITEHNVEFEITSSGKNDEAEQEFSLNQYYTDPLTPGWNHLILPLNDQFDHEHVNYVRIHAGLVKGNATVIKNVKFIKSDIVDCDLSAFAKKDEIQAKELKTIELDLDGAKFVAVDLYMQDPASFAANDAELHFELSSSGDCDDQEYEFVLGKDGLDVSGLVPGWNRVLLPISEATVTKGPVDDANINYARIHVHNPSGNSGWVAIDNIEAVAGIPVYALERDDGEVVAYCEDIGVILTNEELADPEITIGVVNDPAIAAQLINAFRAKYGDVFEGFDAEYETIAISLDDADGLYLMGDDTLGVQLPELGVDAAASAAYDLFAIVEGECALVDFIEDEEGFYYEVEDFADVVYLVVGYVASKAGQTTYEDFTADVTNFEEGTEVYVDVVDINDSEADPELIIAVEDSIEEFQEEFEEGLTYEEQMDNTYEYSVVAVYDVYALNNFEEVQPNGTVKMSIAAPALLSSETAKLYHVHDDGTREEVEFTVENGRWHFELDGFSYLVVVKVTPEVKGNPYTGDMTVLYIALALVAVLGAGVTVLYVKKRNNA